MLRLANIEALLVIAHGEQDIRVHLKQSAELVAELRRLGDKTFEYVTHTTEGHGLLRFEPQIDFHRRLERLFDWYLMETRRPCEPGRLAGCNPCRGC